MSESPPGDDTARPLSCGDTSEVTLTPARRYELEKIANAGLLSTVLVSFVLPPLGYALVRRWGWAALSLLTLHFFLFGHLLVPVHTYTVVKDARAELAAAGVPGY